MDHDSCSSGGLWSEFPHAGSRSSASWLTCEPRPHLHSHYSRRRLLSFLCNSLTHGGGITREYNCVRHTHTHEPDRRCRRETLASSTVAKGFVTAWGSCSSALSHSETEELWAELCPDLHGDNACCCRLHFTARFNWLSLSHLSLNTKTWHDWMRLPFPLHDFLLADTFLWHSIKHICSTGFMVWDCVCVTSFLKCYVRPTLAVLPAQVHVNDALLWDPSQAPDGFRHFLTVFSPSVRLSSHHTFSISSVRINTYVFFQGPIPIISN